MVFTNASRVGAILFVTVGLTVWMGAGTALAGDALGSKSVTAVGLTLLGAGAFGVVLSTWLSGIRALRWLA